MWEVRLSTSSSTQRMLFGRGMPETKSVSGKR
jgi:hypothetical protein